MEQIQTVKIQERDGVEMYTAHIRKSGDRWIGQIKEVPVVQCEGNTKEALLKALDDTLHEVLEARADAWDKQIEEDIKAGKLEHLREEALEDIRIQTSKRYGFWIY